jgi:hypothetical protein
LKTSVPHSLRSILSLLNARVADRLLREALQQLTSLSNEKTRAFAPIWIDFMVKRNG